MEKLNPFSGVTAADIAEAARRFGTPMYLYDGELIRRRCGEAMAMPNAYGLTVRYAMKANSSRSVLRLIAEQSSTASGIAKQSMGFDASSLGEVKRAVLAGIEPEKIILTTQEVPLGNERDELEALMLRGLKYNVCSLRQLELIADFAVANDIGLSIRVHPGVGSGESASRNTGDDYSCFGIHLSDIGRAKSLADSKGVRFTQVHTHIGSGGDPDAWRENIDRELDIVEKFFPDAESVSLGGGLKEARMPDETAADIQPLGEYARDRFIDFYNRTGRRLKMEIEPGTYIMANAGYVVTRVMDKKRTGAEGYNFIIADGGMELNARPVMYGSRHPFYVVSEGGRLLSSEFFGGGDGIYEAVVAGRCCESGDAQSLDSDGYSLPRRMAEPQLGDLIVIGGTGAYCSSMAPFNYNSHVQAAEAMLEGGEMRLIRRRQTMEQMVQNEL